MSQKTKPDSYFVREQRAGEEWFSGTDMARGPWAADACHAGPPSGLVVRKMESLLPEMELVRLTIDLDRPIPLEPIKVEAEISKKGRAVSALSAAIVNESGKTFARATGLAIAPHPLEGHVPTAEIELPSLAEAKTGAFPIYETAHNLPAFPTSCSVMYPPGQDPAPGPTQVWMRSLPLLADEEPSPFQRICPLADCGNAFGRNAEPWEFTFLNADLTINLHRRPVGEWLGSAARADWLSNGIGTSDALLFDDYGPVGRATQNLVIRRLS